jgi:hypothetical protein
MLREEGLLTFYRGIVPSLALCSNHALHMAFYEKFRQLNSSRRGRHVDPNASETLAMGAASKTLSASITYPLYILRTRLFQRAEVSSHGLSKKYKYSGSGDVISRTFRHEGIGGFFKGMLPHLMKAAPSAALTLTFYERLIKLASASW